MTMTLPCLLMILHFSQIFFTDGLTFIGYQPFLNLFRTPGDTALIQVVDGDLYGHLVTGQNLDIIHAQLSGNMSGNDVLIRQLDFEGRVGQCLNNDALKLDNIVLRQKNPSLRFRMCATVSELRIDQRQDFYPVADQCDGVLIMCRQRVICRLHRPAVR